MGRRRVLVTGASRPTGIGAATAAALAARGDVVAVHARADVEAAEAVVASLPGEGHTVVVADLADPDQVAGMVDRAIAVLGGIDVLVNNAAVYVGHPIAETSYAEWQSVWRRTLDVNLVGTANTTWCVVDHLLNRREGPEGASIIMVGSRGAYRGEPVVSAYGASKAGMHAFAQSMAVALAPHGIGVAAVAPGFTATDIAEELLQGPEGDAIVAQHPFGRVAAAAEIGAAVAWLTSPEARWASGTVLDLNGASYLH
ncbi:SDR family oxidoreductase [Umezawaea sp. Da 62-37]|uniref:SDR family NAD(P)-dependent oxidoreductase n=1 Tax=Umezawaea sp. Da 62-37 TaxID=3075927 RepID=UPI0028F71804|nr:SDR family oxidoreductase [Umezawaea sp. Da 62-37]WNV86173.1 SDR family oxidoreductase [Umezawaea sp. Da 62-37]